MSTNTKQRPQRSPVVQTMIEQIGGTTVMAVSGGRVGLAPNDPNVLELPAGAGYYVVVRYQPGSDTYLVTREFRRAGKRFSHGEQEAWCDTLSDTVWQASCFRSYSFPVGA